MVVTRPGRVRQTRSGFVDPHIEVSSNFGQQISAVYCRLVYLLPQSIKLASRKLLKLDLNGVKPFSCQGDSTNHPYQLGRRAVPLDLFRGRSPFVQIVLDSLAVALLVCLIKLRHRSLTACRFFKVGRQVRVQFLGRLAVQCLEFLGRLKG